MMTFKQSTQNLGHSARQAAIIGVAGLGLAAVISVPASAQTHHSGERSDDFTMMPRNMTPLEKPLCPTGQIAVGSTCVDVPAQPGVGSVRSWVNYFLGQTRPLLDATNNFRNIGSAKINTDGTVTFTSYKFPAQTAEVPYGSNGVGLRYDYSFCQWANMGAAPNYTASEKLSGSPPSNWYASFSGDYEDCRPIDNPGGG